MNKKYAIFDMDGTLVDSMGYWNHLAEEYLHSKGIEHVSNDFLERIKPMTMTECTELFVKEFGLQKTPDEIATEINELMNDHYIQDIPLKEGVREYLKKLYDAGTALCVASATDIHLIKACLERLGIVEWFSFLLSCEQVGVGKSKPDVYLEAAKRFGVLPEEIAVYEDAVYAAHTAKEAGFYVIGVFDESGAEEFDKLCMISDEIIQNW